MAVNQRTNYTVRNLIVSRGVAIGGSAQTNILNLYNNWVNPNLTAGNDVTVVDMTRCLIHRSNRFVTLSLNVTFNVPLGTDVVTFTGLPYDSINNTTIPVKLDNDTGPISSVAYANVNGDTLQIIWQPGFVTPIATPYVVTGQIKYQIAA